VGFFTTLAFFANWPTNPSNSYRVTPTRRSSWRSAAASTTGNTTVQVARRAWTRCTCSRARRASRATRRSIRCATSLKQSYSLTYFQQLSTAQPKNPPLPAEGVVHRRRQRAVRGSGVATLAQAMASTRASPSPGRRSSASSPTQRLPRGRSRVPAVAKAFSDSKFDFKTLVRELYSSPLVTYAAQTKTAAEGVVMSIARRETYCDRLGNRLGVKDSATAAATARCQDRGPGAQPVARHPRLRLLARRREPVTPHDPNLFFASATEKICMAVARQLVETATATWKVGAPDPAIAEFVQDADGRAGERRCTPRLVDILTRHYMAAKNAKETPADALRSTFTVACSSPLAVSMGL
jgi:hypothetical protein